MCALILFFCIFCEIIVCVVFSVVQRIYFVGFVSLLYFQLYCKSFIRLSAFMFVAVSSSLATSAIVRKTTTLSLYVCDP